MAGDRPAGDLLRPAAGVGAAVEPPAGGALVDLAGAVRDRLPQPVGVAARMLHLIGKRRAVDAAVGHPPGRQPAAPPLPQLTRRLAARGGVGEQLLEVDVVVELLDLVGARAPDRLLQSVGERSRPGRAFGVSPVMPALRGPFPSSAGTSPVAGAARARWRVGLADDAPVLAGRVVEPVELPVGDPDGARVQALERPEVLLTEHDQPQPSQCSQVGGVDDPVLSPCEQVDGGPGGEVPRQRSAGRREREHLRGEGRQDHVSDGRPQRPADEPATQQVGRELPYAVGLHPRLLEQPAVDRELPLDRIRGLGEGDVVLDRPALGVPGVHRLVDRYAEAAQDRPPSSAPAAIWARVPSSVSESR